MKPEEVEKEVLAGLGGAYKLPKRYLAEWRNNKPQIVTVYFDNGIHDGICYRPSEHGGFENWALGTEGVNVFETVAEAREGAARMGRAIVARCLRLAQKETRRAERILLADCSTLEPVE